jgi:hypothetical protein
METPEFDPKCPIEELAFSQAVPSILRCTNRFFELRKICMAAIALPISKY